MSQYPPPGAPEGYPPPPPGPAPAPGGWGPAPWGPPVHKPGVVPLRPLTLGDMFGGALQTVRRNPRATVGMALVVSFVFMLPPMLLTVVMGAADVLPSFTSSSDSVGISAGYWVSNALTLVFTALSSLVITGLIVRIVEQAVLGRRMSAGEAWTATRGRLLPLLGLTLLVLVGSVLVVGLPVGAALAVGLLLGNVVVTVLLVVLAALAGIALLLFLYARFVLLATPALVLEGTGVVASLRRGAALTRGQFWRVLGIYLLASLAASFAGQVIAVPLAVAGAIGAFALPSGWGTASLLLANNLSSVLTGALVGPFTSGVLVLQYFDQRFRKEGLDIELLDRTLGSGASGPGGFPGQPR